jgi:multiple sugar transport system ATP-binding protein
VGLCEQLTGLDDVTVAFGDDRPVLRGIRLLAAPGEVLVVVGPSGSGKTTALRAVAGLEAVRTGRVLVAGRDVTRTPTPQRDVSMVFQQAALVPFLDVAANMASAARLRGASEPEIAHRVADRGRRLRIGRLLSRMPQTLSPGEGGLAGIGRAVVRTPAAFLFDEPLAHLDAGERSRTRRTMVEFVRNAGVAALYVTHDQAEAMAVGDRLAELRDGEVVQVGRPREVYDRPADLFVAGFVGSPEIGLLPARVVASGTGAGFQVGERTLPLWGSLPPELADRVGERVLLGLRPEDVGEAGPGADPGSVSLRVLVRRIEQMRPDAVVVADLELPDARLSARVPSGTPLRAGMTAELAVDARRAHVFDPVSGRALHHPRR